MASVVTSVSEVAGNITEMKAMDANRYATKKTIAQGMLDIALLTANASQLRYILKIGEQHEFYKLMLVLISLSIIMQLAVGILFVIIGSLNINRKKDQLVAIIMNDVSTGILLVMLSLMSLNKSPYHRKIADRLNHLTLAFVFLSLFCDIIKMNFGLNPAIPVKDKNE